MSTNTETKLRILSAFAEASEVPHAWDQFILPTGDGILSIEAYFDNPLTTKHFKHPEEVTPLGTIHYTIFIQRRSPFITLYAETLLNDEEYSFPMEDTPKVTLSMEELLTTLFYLLLKQ